MALKKEIENKIEGIEKEFNDKLTPKTYLLQSFVDQAIDPFVVLKKDKQ